jgi:transcriptional regulator with XRE-family HTH domain
MNVESIYKQISSTLKALRAERGWSLDKAALKTGVSKAMLGQIEREESSPTIATLWKIASGFNIAFSSFIADLDDMAEHVNQPIYRAGQADTIHPADEKIRVLSLFPFDNQVNFEVFMIELLPGCEHLSPAHQSGVIEHVIVIEGAIEVLVDGNWSSLNKGDRLRFHADKPHGYRNLTSRIASIYDIIHYP